MNVARRERMSVSRQARDYIRSHRSIRVPLPLIPSVARAVRKAVARNEAKPLQAALAAHDPLVSRRQVHGVTVVTIQPRSAPNPAPGYCLYIHSGAFVFGQALDTLAVLLAEDLQLPVLSIEYSLAPESAHPVAFEECLSVVEELTSTDPNPYVAVGVSAGGALVLSVMQHLIARDDPEVRLPAAVALMAPWSDLTRTGDSYYGNERRDPLIRWGSQLSRAARAYVGSADPADPTISPIYSPTFGGHPPTMVVSGTRDLFLSNAVRTYWALRDGGSPALLRIWEAMWHGFFEHADIPEAQQARVEVGQFLCAALDGRRPPCPADRAP